MQGELPSDREARQRLVRLVRDQALWDATRGLARGARDAHGLGVMAALLAGFGSPLIFLPDAQGRFRGHPGPHQPARASEFAIVPGSIAAQALARATLFDTATERATPFDEQLAHLLGAAALAYCPLVAAGQPVALAAFALDEAAAAQLPRHRLLAARLAQFGEEPVAGEEVSALRAEIRRAVHEVNNPLSVIKTYLAGLLPRLAGDEAARHALATVQEEIERVGQILRTLSRPLPLATSEQVNVNRLLADLLALLRDGLFAPARISLVTRFAPVLPTVAVQADKLKQILLNLLKNAAEAMPDGGTLTVTTRDRVVRDGRPCVEITLADTGPGIPPHLLDRLFTSELTTKNETHAGLGLSIVGRLAQELNISVTVASDSSGTMVSLLIPRTTAPDN